MGSSARGFANSAGVNGSMLCFHVVLEAFGFPVVIPFKQSSSFEVWTQLGFGARLRRVHSF